jgi:hypothetical protein
MQNDGYFVDVILVYIIKAFIYSPIVKLEGHIKNHARGHNIICQNCQVCAHLERNGIVTHFPCRSVR